MPLPRLSWRTDYVVFLAQSALPTAKDATGLEMQVFGDGSGTEYPDWRCRRQNLINSALGGFNTLLAANGYRL